MTRIKRWLSLALTFALTFSLMVSPGTAAATQFATVYLDAQTMDFPSQTLHVELYRRNEAGRFQPTDAVRYACQINRIAGGGDFCIQPQTNGIWVTVDYLTDLNRDGIYELPDGEAEPVYDSMTTSGTLSAWSINGKQTLKAGQTYTLSTQTLIQRGKTVLRERANANSKENLGLTADPLPNQEHILYMITLHHISETDGLEYDFCCYLKLYDSVIVPSDVPNSAPYYDAVKFAIQRGFLSGTGADTFSPDLSLTRSQLAQILWRLEGSPAAKDGGFSDVTAADWFYGAASWCKQSGLMSGVSANHFGPNITLSREQLALILLQYTRHVGKHSSGSQSLTGFSDAASVSDWAREGMEWAVGNGLMGRGQTALQPGGSVTRAELAVILQTYCQSILDD